MSFYSKSKSLQCVEELTNLADTLESIQADRNRKIGKYDVKGSSDWWACIKRTGAELFEKKHNAIVSKLSKEREKYKGYP